MNYREKIKKLLSLKTKQRFLINGRYSCQINDIQPFQIFKREQNCPMYQSSIFVTITNTDTIARIDLNYNFDINIISCVLVFYNFNDQPISMTTITNLEFL